MVQPSTFYVPDEDAESISDNSDSGSCQVLDSHPRTFSVPSSGDEGDDPDEDDAVVRTSKRSFLASVNASGSLNPDRVLSRPRNTRRGQEKDGQSQQMNEAQVESQQILAAATYDLPDSLAKTSSDGRAESRNVPTLGRDDLSDSLESDSDAQAELPKIPTTAKYDITDHMDSDSDDEGPDVLHSGQAQYASGRKNINIGDTATAFMSIDEVPDTYQSPESKVVKAQQGRESMTSGHNLQERGAAAEQESSSHPDQSDNIDSGGPSQGSMEPPTAVQACQSIQNEASYDGHSSFRESQASLAQQSGMTNHMINDDPGEDNYREISVCHPCPPLPHPSTASQHEHHEDLISKKTSGQAGLCWGYAAVDDLEKEHRLGSMYRQAQTTIGVELKMDDQTLAPPLSSSLAVESNPLGYTFSEAIGYQNPYHYVSQGTYPRSSSFEDAYTFSNAYPQAQLTSAAKFHPALARPPSPSDAALARKATLSRAECYASSHDAANENSTLGRSYSREDNDLGQGTSTGPSLKLLPPPVRVCGCVKPDHIMGEQQSSMESPSSQLSHECQLGRGIESDGVHPKITEYEQGSLSRKIYSSHSTTAGSSEDSLAINPSRIVKLKVVPQSDQDSRSHEVMRTGFPERQGNEHVKSSKVDISNLVNAQVEGSRGKKRKSDQMSSAATECTATGTSMRSSSIASAALPKTTADTKALNREKRVNESSLQKLRRHQRPSDVDIMEEGPARKKPRTSTSRAGTIGKVLSGVCLGIAGAFVALIAATPADVWDEALREAVKLQ
ncbi:MAG: hypothetical protein Q9219_007337 [cf. Caloplaca sp. 3 TL-2023]